MRITRVVVVGLLWCAGVCATDTSGMQQYTFTFKNMTGADGELSVQGEISPMKIRKDEAVVVPSNKVGEFVFKIGEGKAWKTKKLNVKDFPGTCTIVFTFQEGASSLKHELEYIITVKNSSSRDGKLFYETKIDGKSARVGKPVSKGDSLRITNRELGDKPFHFDNGLRKSRDLKMNKIPKAATIEFTEDPGKPLKHTITFEPSSPSLKPMTGAEVAQIESDRKEIDVKVQLADTDVLLVETTKQIEEAKKMYTLLSTGLDECSVKLERSQLEVKRLQEQVLPAVLETTGQQN